MREVLVIGGSRYFGRLLVTLLQEAGNRVTVVNRGSPPPAGVGHLVADRDDEAALRAACGPRTFDVVIDQVCYTPAQAEVACRVFADRVGRYVMTSTMEVYDPATSPGGLPAAPGVPMVEDAVRPADWPVRLDLPWHDPERLATVFDPATGYAEGKRQAEAMFTRSAPFRYASVRSAHVLGGGARDFTGRLAHYVERVTAGQPVAVHPDPLPTSFIQEREIAEFLRWAAAADFVGPVNAASHGELTAIELCDLVATRVGTPPRYQVVEDGPTSPFSFDRYYAMDNGRAERLGFQFGAARDWLPTAIDDALAATAEDRHAVTRDR